MKIIVSLSLCIVYPLLSFSQKNDSLLIQQIQTVYANCKTYTDRITVSRKFITEDGIRRNDDELETLFDKDGFFRLSFFRHAESKVFRRREVIYRENQEKSIEYWRFWGDRKLMPPMEGNLDQILSAAAGTNGGISFLIPKLLLKNEFGQSQFAKEMFQFIRKGDEVKDGELCYKFYIEKNVVRSEEENEKINGLFGRELAKRVNSTYTYWFSKKTKLLIRVEQHSQFDDRMTTNTVIKYQPGINKKIPKKDRVANFPSNF